MAMYLPQGHLVFWGFNTSKDKAALFWLALPTANSMTTTGSPNTTKNRR